MKSFLLYVILITIASSCIPTGNNKVDKEKSETEFVKLVGSDRSLDSLSARFNTSRGMLLEKGNIDFTQLVGFWRPKDNVAACLEIGNDSSFCCVADNQIYIRIALKECSEINSYHIFYEATKDLGRGGVMLPWDSYSLEIPIAKIEFTNENDANFRWLGFYNIKNKKYEFIESDFTFDTDSIVVRLEKSDE